MARPVALKKDAVKDAYDFSKGERGKFYDSEAAFSLPVYLEPDVNETLRKLAEEKGIDLGVLVNDWLRMSIKLVQSVR
ncbi:MAG: hypothetical protein M3498_09915 [Deinococcota bacterium]|nr:hypothetical protein [Deinococcota bacterium]